MGYSKSSNNGKDVIKTNHPILGMMMSSERLIFDIKGQ
jgi:hypothetical protein